MGSDRRSELSKVKLLGSDREWLVIGLAIGIVIAD